MTSNCHTHTARSYESKHDYGQKQEKQIFFRWRIERFNCQSIVIETKLVYNILIGLNIFSFKTFTIFFVFFWRLLFTVAVRKEKSTVKHEYTFCESLIKRIYFYNIATNIKQNVFFTISFFTVANHREEILKHMNHYFFRWNFFP